MRRWWASHRVVRLSRLVFPPWLQAVRWSMSHRSAGVWQVGKTQARARARTRSARPAGGRYLVRPTSTTVPLAGSVTRRLQVPPAARAQAVIAGTATLRAPMRTSATSAGEAAGWAMRAVDNDAAGEES